MNLRDDLQVEITRTLAFINDHYEELQERADRDNFEIIYHQIFDIEPAEQHLRLVVTLFWHETMQVGVLKMRYERYNAHIIIKRWGYADIQPKTANLAFIADSSGAALQYAMQEIVRAEATYLELVATEGI